MIEKMLFKYYAMLAAFMLLTCTQVHIEAMNWHGGNQSGNVNITPSSGLDIAGINYLLTPISIINNTGSPTPANVTMSADAIVSSSQELYFYVSTDSVTDVYVAYDLLFSGSYGQNFLITVSGGGTLNFNISGGETLSFALANTLNASGSTCSQTSMVASSTANSGVIFLVDMVGGSPTVNFQPATSTLTENATVEVGYNSAISFLGNAFGQTGTINFDASIDPASTGRFILQIDNGGAVVNDVAQLMTGFPVTLQNIAFNLANENAANGSPTIEFVANNVPGGFAGTLIVNNNSKWSGLTANPFCELAPTSTTVIKKGFVLGAGSNLTVNAGTYIDYVVTITNVTLTPSIPNDVLNVPCQRFTNRIIKDRNPAAMIIDGNPDNSDPAQINMYGNSAIYFRSGVDCQGNSCEFGADSTISFTINPANNFSNEGTILLDVEGPLVVNGNSTPDDVTLATAFQILSWQVAPTGGSVLINQTDTTFPLRTFAQDANGNYLQYGSGCFFINNKMQLSQMHLQHTDEIHPIYEDNVAGESSASYIGGDRLNICLPTNPLCPCANSLVVPAIQFYNSFFDLHTSAAVTGLSLQVVNDSNITLPFDANTTQFVFYGNGRCIDNGTGRSLIIGTEVGSEASDWVTIVNRNGQLDVIQTNSGENPVIDLIVSVSYNNYKITPNISGNINGQLGVNTIYLAHASNISIGSQDASFGGASLPSFFINGEFFSFSTQGGDLNSPETSGTTGQGGMFVDYNGVVDVGQYRANFGMMVTKSSNGNVNLPSNQVFFDPRVGIAQWQLNLNDPSELVIVPEYITYSDYTIDWQNLMKDYCSTYSQALFVPYEPTTVPFVPATLYPVTAANLNGLPTIYGSVEQLQVLNSRLGDQVHLLIDGTYNGIVREFVFLPGTASATAPVGVLVLQNNALVGLGTASRNQDSLNASVVLGINGLTLLPNGDATVRLNVNTLINNYCHIVTGTLFGATPVVGNRLLIDSVVPTELRIKSDGVLDLTQFTSTMQVLVISGQVNMVLEPGAQVLLGGGTLIFEGDSQCYCEPDTSVNLLTTGTTVEATDGTRVSFIGSGRVTFKENAQFNIPRGAMVGIESVGNGYTNYYSAYTNQSWALTDNAQFSIGSTAEYGGAFQIGNVFQNEANPSIDFTLILTGVGALLDLNSQGFLGFGAGIVNKPNSGTAATTAPNTWTIGGLYNVNSITLSIPEGTFQNNQTYSGDNNLAGLFAIAPINTGVGSGYTFNYDPVNADVLGGGNMVLLDASVTGTNVVNPIVLNVAGVTVPGVTAGIMASKAALEDTPKQALTPIANGTGIALFNYLTMSEFNTQETKIATIFKNALGESTIGFVYNIGGINTIQRQLAGNIQGLNGTYVNPSNSLTIGAVGIDVDPAAPNAPALSQINPQQ